MSGNFQHQIIIPKSDELEIVIINRINSLIRKNRLRKQVKNSLVEIKNLCIDHHNFKNIGEEE